MTGQLFDIQRFSLDDGPGIRTIVFFKGCNFACSWCHNPEAISKGPILMRMDSLCTRCGRCMAACAQKAVALTGGRYVTDHALCTRCRRCIDLCPASSLKLSGYAMDTAQVMKTVIKDMAYYEESGGGVTFSGGEPMMQPDFLLELLRESKAAGLHTAIETNGSGDRSCLERISPLLDYVMIDLKHMDDRKHRAFTGAGNARTLEAVGYLSAHNHTDVRIPVIPTFNDTAGELQAMLDFLRDHAPRQVTLLPYHVLGVGKYGSLGLPYPLGDCPAMPAARLEELLSQVDAGKLNLRISEK